MQRFQTPLILSDSSRIALAPVYGKNNLRRLQRINSQHTRVSLRVEGGGTPEHLQLAADEAARSGVLRTSIEYAGGARHTIQLWDELRTWDPGD